MFRDWKIPKSFVQIVNILILVRMTASMCKTCTSVCPVGKIFKILKQVLKPLEIHLRMFWLVCQPRINCPWTLLTARCMVPVKTQMLTWASINNLLRKNWLHSNRNTLRYLQNQNFLWIVLIVPFNLSTKLGSKTQMIHLPSDEFTP
jgi:Fe-S-cluster-containing hydrogenase component 2